IGWTVPSVCLLTAIGLGISFFRPKYMRCALLHYLCWMLMFTIYILVILTLASYKPCCCIGLSERLTWVEHLIVNGIIMTATILAMSWPSQYNETNLKIFAAAGEAPSQPLKNGKYLKRKEV